MWKKLKEKFKNENSQLDSDLPNSDDMAVQDEEIETVFQNINLAGDAVSPKENKIIKEASPKTSSELSSSLTTELTEKKETPILYGSSNLLPDLLREPAFIIPELKESKMILTEPVLAPESTISLWDKLKESKLLAAGLTAVIVVICGSLIYANAHNKTIKIVTADNKTTEVKTIGSITTAEALEKGNITLNPHESTNMSLNDNLSDGDEILISKPKEVLVVTKKKTYKVETALETDKDITKQAGLKTTKNTVIEKIDKDGLKVYGVVGKNEKLKYKEKTVGYKTIYKEVDKIKGNKDEKVIKKGVNGKEKVVQIVSYNKKGKLKKRTTVYKEVTKKVTNKIVHVAKDSDTTIFNSSNNTVTKVKKGDKMTVDVTAYCSCSKCCGKTTGITASGTKATAGRTVAAYSGFPFGTKLYFPYFKNNGNNGVFVVEDRGGAITAGRVDIYFGSHSEALAFGRRTLDMYVVK